MNSIPEPILRGLRPLLLLPGLFKEAFWNTGIVHIIFQGQAIYLPICPVFIIWYSTKLWFHFIERNRNKKNGSAWISLCFELDKVMPIPVNASHPIPHAFLPVTCMNDESTLGMQRKLSSLTLFSIYSIMIVWWSHLFSTVLNSYNNGLQFYF